MSEEVKVPDIGDFADVPVIEVLVGPGDTVAKEDPLVVLESDKATMDVPSPLAGKVEEVKVSVGDKVSQGDVILTLEPGEAKEDEEKQETPAEAAPEEDGAEKPTTSHNEPPPPAAEKREEAKPSRPEGKRVVVIGSGPGGYTAAFRAADLGLEVTLVERYDTLGGVCLNVGCIPSKALLHAARVTAEVEEASEFGLSYGEPELDLDKLRGWKDEVVGKLTGGLTGLAKKRKVNVVTGTASFKSDRAIAVEGGEDVEFDHCVIAAGSQSVRLPGFPDDPRIIDSTGALELADVPERLLVVGGGIIGLEMATVYDALGSKVTVVELTDTLIPGCDRDLVKPLQDRIAKRYEAILLGVKVAGVEAADDGLHVSFEGADDAVFDRILLAVGRRPNGKDLNAEAAGVEVDDRGFIPSDGQMRTNVGHIYAIGDIKGEPMLAHKATHEAKVAAEVIAGENVAFDAQAIPSVAYTDPEIAWMGLTETQAKADGIKYEKSSFPWAASGRALALNGASGLTKLLVEPESGRILGAGMVGPNAGELIAEATLAIEMGANAEDIGLTIHPHPTLSETVAFAAEMATGTITDLYAPKRK